MKHEPIIVWFRQDLRLTDNPALAAAAATGRPVIALYVRDDHAHWAPGAASRWWLHGSLAALAAALDDVGAPLVRREGAADRVLKAIIDETGATAVYWNRCYEPQAIARDTAIKKALHSGGIAAQSFNAGLLFEPWTIKTKAGEPYGVFTPFWRACLAQPEPAKPAAAPKAVTAFKEVLKSEALESWGLLPTKPDWAGGLRATWTPGEAGAAARLKSFMAALDDYKTGRDRPGEDGTSRLSPHLHFGEIGPRQIWHRARSRPPSASADVFLKELGWREFSHHLLFHHPRLADEPLRPAFAAFPWRRDGKALAAWRRGATGYPIVDAGMRQLWETGWMHNRVRMVVASFLIKHLLIRWQDGAAWFWDTLVDADLANNAASWQWVAGSGADAAPFFRIFNPVLQGERFDPDGAYVRRFVPELAKLPNDVIHKPWTADEAVLKKAGVVLGETYPHPIVDHAAARARALAAFAEVKGA